MLAITIWQPWASLIAAGCKVYESRTWDYRARYRLVPGDRIAIHAGRRPVDAAEVEALLGELRRLAPGAARERALALLMGARRNPDSLPLSAVLATAVLGEPRRVSAQAALTGLPGRAPRGAGVGVAACRCPAARPAGRGARRAGVLALAAPISRRFPCGAQRRARCPARPNPPRNLLPPHSARAPRAARAI
jgi:hypothetical protein